MANSTSWSTSTKQLRATLDIVFDPVGDEARGALAHQAQEWAPDRKIDLGQLVMDQARERVRAQMKEMRKQATPVA